jgi:hypothetical protein
MRYASMAKQFIHFDLKNGVEYATLCSPMRVDGKKTNNPQYLGKVIDKQQGIYQNRDQGTFKFSLHEGFSEYTPPVVEGEEKLILDFGDIYLLSEYMKKSGIYDIIGGTLPESGSTVLALVMFRILAQSANCYAYDWWEGSFARHLFPDAALSSQHLSGLLSKLGDEAAQRRFFNRYLPFVCGGSSREAILIDSTGLTNKINFPLAAVNTHGGKTSRETRLILAVDGANSMPLFYRYAAGNVVDVTTLKATIAELAQYGIETKLAIVDAGYYSDGNVKSLLNNGIAFLTRVHPNRVIFKDLLKGNIHGLEDIKYLTRYHERLVYIKRVEIPIAGHGVYAYIAIDVQRRNDESYHYLDGALDDRRKGGLSDGEIERKMDTLGVFVLICSECLETQDILPMYYTRQTIEQIFDVGKNNLDLLPLRVHNEETFRGHLVLSFMASAAYLSFSYSLKKSSLNAIGVLLNARNLKCKVYDNAILIKEPTKITREAASLLKIELPDYISV